MSTLNKQQQELLKPVQALEYLKEGNRRFVTNIKMHLDLMKQVLDTAEAQYPYAAIVSCMDSRNSNELIFDQGIGDIFSIRIAGNVITEDILGSLEFACKIAGSKMIVLLGHTRCGAIQGACDGVQLGHLSDLLRKIHPAIEAETTVTQDRHGRNHDFVRKVAELNARLSLQQIISLSPILKELIENGTIGVIAALYHVETGIVDFFEDTLILDGKSV